MANNHSTQVMTKLLEPCWRESVKLPTFQPLQGDIEVDVVIVGGGITGISAAYLLTNEGLRVAILEADRLLNGTTGHTTAKLTAQHGLIYDELKNHMGTYKAQLYYEANMAALNFVKQTIETHQIECDFAQDDALIYALTENYAEKLEKEFVAYQELGIESELLDSIPLNIQVQKALRMKNQAQFHPLKYLARLLQEVVNKGGLIFEGTTAIDVLDDPRPTVITREGYKATCNKVLTCTHFPFYEGNGFYFTRMYAERAYVIVVRPKITYPGGMYINAETPTRSLRQVMVNNEPMVLVIGETHKAGQGVEDTREHYQALESFARDVVGVQEVLYRWSTQDLSTLDKIAYIGEITSKRPNILVATGYRKWGMTTGTTAAFLFRDMVLGRDNSYQELYTPSRFYLDPSLKTFFTKNANVAFHLIKGKIEFPIKKAEDLAPGEGDVITSGGKRAGAYKDSKGNLYVVDTTCTHLGCEVEWNPGDLTWDCPCHGSRFSYIGEVVEGPAEQPLSKSD